MNANGSTDGDWPVWTGTYPNGTIISNAHCANWTSNSNGANGKIGDRGQKNSNWTSAYNASGWSGCATSFGRIYCFEE